MNVGWDVAALDDVRDLVPQPLRQGLRDHLRQMLWPGQGLRCQDARYSDCYFVKYRQWLVMYTVIAEDTIVVVGVEYNYGSPL
jgi:hypothetical protein